MWTFRYMLTVYDNRARRFSHPFYIITLIIVQFCDKSPNIWDHSIVLFARRC